MTTGPSTPWWKLTPEKRRRGPWGFVWRTSLVVAVLWTAWWSLFGAVRAAFGRPPTGWPTLDAPVTVAVWILTHLVSGLVTGALWALVMWKLAPPPPSADGGGTAPPTGRR